MKKTLLLILAAGVASMFFSGCAESNYNSGYNSYESPNDRAVDRAISEEMNSLSDADIAQLNKLK